MYYGAMYCGSILRRITTGAILDHYSSSLRLSLYIHRLVRYTVQFRVSHTRIFSEIYDFIEISEFILPLGAKAHIRGL